MKVLLLNESPHPNGCTATALKERISVFDAEVLQTMRNLAHYMTFLMKVIADGREKYSLPEVEHGAFTSFPDGK